MEDRATCAPNPNCSPQIILYHLPPISLMSAPFRHSLGLVLVPLGALFEAGVEADRGSAGG